MCSAAIDRNALNALFDNQQQLDDLFDSIFNDDNYFISGASPSQSESPCLAYDEGCVFTPAKNRHRETRLTEKAHTPYRFVLPVALEIAIIYFVMTQCL